VILIQSPAKSRGRWTIDCDVHGHVAHQTALVYCTSRANLHRDEAGCAEALLTVERTPGHWAVTCDRCGPLGTRSRQAAALGLARSHAENGTGANRGKHTPATPTP